MEFTIVYWGYMGIMENIMETTIEEFPIDERTILELSLCGFCR